MAQVVEGPLGAGILEVPTTWAPPATLPLRATGLIGMWLGFANPETGKGLAVGSLCFYGRVG